MSKMTSVNFGDMPMDELVNAEGLTTNGTQRTLDNFITRSRGKTLRETAADMQEPDLRWVGTPRQIADEMEAAMDYVGGDGFLVRGMITRHFMTELVDGLIPELQRRGLTRKTYSGKTLRENLTAF
jgi:long-chain alkane monooxygenase